MGQTKEIKRYLRKNLDHKRYEHTLSVRRTARKLARRHMEFASAREKKMFLKKVSLAALLHDVDKPLDPQELWTRIKDDPHVDQRYISEFREVWHAFSSALTARGRFGMEDEELLNALRFHTTGRSGMSDLEKIIYLADYIEPGRSFPGVEAIRSAARRGIDAGCLAALEHSIGYLRSKGNRISPYTLEARKDLMRHGSF